MCQEQEIQPTEYFSTYSPPIATNSSHLCKRPYIPSSLKSADFEENHISTSIITSLFLCPCDMSQMFSANSEFCFLRKCLNKLGNYLVVTLLTSIMLCNLQQNDCLLTFFSTINLQSSIFKHKLLICIMLCNLQQNDCLLMFFSYV